MLGDKMNKLIKNGKVAVLYSPGFGAGWFTWNPTMPELIFEPAIAQFVLDEKFDELQTYVALKYPQIYDGGMMDLEVAWVPALPIRKVGRHARRARVPPAAGLHGAGRLVEPDPHIAHAACEADNKLSFRA
jgi:hypothetical protein